MGRNIPISDRGEKTNVQGASGLTLLGMAFARSVAETSKMNRLTSILTISLLFFTHAVMAAGAGDIESETVILRVEKVGPKALGLVASKEANTFTRVVAKGDNGKYLVAVHSNAGILRMQGAYLDSTLTLEDGIFFYYHPNGRLESKGAYQAGIKAGTWFRYGLDGKQLSERNYTGRSVNELVNGTTIASVRDAQPVERAGTADKRNFVAAEF